MSELIVGQKVVTPYTDKEGEVQHVVGILLSINSRFAKVQLDEGSVISVGKSKVEAFVPPKKEQKISREGHNYIKTKSANGRKSCDNGDTVAMMLRGKNLGEVYEIAAQLLDEPISSLVKSYEHLNAGQQRMCLGNRLRKNSK